MKCLDEYRGERCTRDRFHDGLHRSDRVTWGFRDWSIPEWVRRRNERALPAKDMTSGNAA